MDTEKLHSEKSIKAVWKSFSEGSDFEQLQGNITVDVAIIGGGITGITTAQQLKEAGYKVAVLEAMKVGGGSTGHSTGNLYVVVEEGFDKIQSKYDTDTVAKVIASRNYGLKLIEDNVSRFSIDCDFNRKPWYLYSSDEKHTQKIEDIYDAAKSAGIAIEEVLHDELPFRLKKGIKIENQAQFNPLRYVQELSAAINDINCHIYENTCVEAIDEGDDIITVVTNKGTVTAKYVVHATHTPKGLMADFHSLLGTYREYGIAVKLASGVYPEGIFWGYYNENERFSVRSYTHNGEKFLLAVGQPHRVGQKEDNIENIKNLEKFLAERFDVDGVTHIWGGQNYKSADMLPYIGRRSKNSNIFVATGFATDGLIWGTVAATLICDTITGRENEYTALYDASRHSPLKVTGKFVEENLNNAGQILKDYLLPKDKELEDIPVKEGKIVNVDGKKLAVYHDVSGTLKACSAICTHMGCVVHWNSAEKTWDCPCHASRFDTNGDILEGPALKPLERVTISTD